MENAGGGFACCNLESLLYKEGWQIWQKMQDLFLQ